MDVDEVRLLVAALRAEGNDLTGVEAKRATGGYPTTVATTLCAFGNTPGGGVLILGLDEEAGFAATGVYDAAACKKALASQARQAIRPPLVLSQIEDVEIEGATLVVATVDETSASSKPCRLASSGKAYLRSYDGDYTLSEAEEQAFLTARTTPTFDREPVAGTSTADLDGGHLSSYLAECRSSSSALRALDDDEVLFRTGVTATAPQDSDVRVLTVAGLLALGTYPQQHLPNCVIQASVAPRTGDPSGTRASDVARFDGPLPVMLDEALSWVRRTTRTRVRFGDDGRGRNEPEFPAEAVRELLSNALIHRDLGPHALVQATTLRLDEQQLVLTNPGGLWGITVDRLGHEGITSARNGTLLRICQNVRTNAGNRVVEALATGIPTVLAALREAGMLPPRFYDQGVSFTVRVPNHTLLAKDDLEWLGAISTSVPLSDQQRHALVAMRHGATWTNRSLRAAFPMDSRDAQRALAGLVEAGFAVAEGERGSRRYRSALDGVDVRVKEPRRADGDDRTEPPRTPAATGTSAVATVEDLLRDGARTAEELSTLTGLSRRQVTYALAALRARGTAVLRGSRGRRDSRYELVDDRRA